MGKNSNEVKAGQLGMSFGTACHRLRKQLLFQFARRLELTTCSRCGLEIQSADDLSIEHIQSWLHSADPVELFFDTENIAFAHRSCNLTRRQQRRPVSLPAGSGWCSNCERVRPLNEFHRSRAQRTGVASQCKSCLKAHGYYRTSEGRRARNWGHNKRKANRTGAPAQV